ncbi:MAG TPA: undecaprenyl diphosphate synthase family protein, partial [Caldisericia bacterium]|nr:undecaprenyl diphosphate synthase family protein [Caldisericia bacterium]
SNFFLYQISYTELYFTEKLWPDFDENDFEEAIKTYSRRKRKFGSI